MSTRRQLCQIADAGAAIAQAEQHEDHEAAGAKPAKKTARYFTKKADLELLAKLVDHIIPRSDTPGAADANVHYYIDWLAHTNATFGAKIQGDIAWIRSQKFMSKTHG